MISEIKKYDMYRAGEYIRNSNQDEITYFKLIDEISDIGLRLKILRLVDNINNRNTLYYGIGILILMGMSVCLGFIIGYSYTEIITLLNGLKP